MKTRLAIVAVCDKQQEFIDLGYATDGNMLEAALARVVVYASYWGRWMGQRIRIVADSTLTLKDYTDVTDEACEVYISKNGDDAGVSGASKERRAATKKILDAEWEPAS